MRSAGTPGQLAISAGLSGCSTARARSARNSSCIVFAENSRDGRSATRGEGSRPRTAGVRAPVAEPACSRTSSAARRASSAELNVTADTASLVPSSPIRRQWNRAPFSR